MNLSLRFWKPSNNFRIGELVSLDLENISSYEIGIPVDSGIVALVFENNAWIKLTNKATYIPLNVNSSNSIPSDLNQLVFPKSPDNPGVTSIDLVPQFITNDNSKNIRVVVVGVIYKDGLKTTERTGAFIDIELKP